MRRVAWLAGVAWIVASGAVGTGRAATTIPIRVDPRVELLSLIFRLAGNEEYAGDLVPGYVADVDAAFGGAADHPAVAAARRLYRDFDISYDAPMSLAVHLTDPPELALRVPLSPYPESLGERWREVDLPAFLTQVRAFAADTGFLAFFAGHQGLYDETAERLQATLGSVDVAPWLAAFFGEERGAAFTIEPALLNGGHCYGPRLAGQGIAEEFHSILGVWQVDATGQPTFPADVAGVVVHEFAHSFVNPLLAEHTVEFAEPGRALLAAAASEMAQQAYTDGETVVNETVVRAVTARWLAGSPLADQLDGYLASQRQRGFTWVPGLADLLTEYEAERGQYPTFATFLPRVRAFLVEWTTAEEDRRSAAPHLAAMIPPNGAQDVDPATTVLVFTFDRAMQTNKMSVMNTGGAFPEVTGKPSYDAAGTTLTIPVRLQPGTTYEFALNRPDGGSFQDLAGHPLPRTVIRFTTRSD